MKITIALMVIAFTVSTSCQKEKERPEITLLELGDGESHSDNHTAKIGGDVHMELDVLAEGKIDKIQVRIHPEGDHSADEGHNEWEIDTTYTKFSGLKNTIFHEHLQIDESAEPGEYHFDFIVTDMEGYQSSVDADLEINE